MTRQFAADDYSAIRARLRELKPEVVVEPPVEVVAGVAKDISALPITRLNRMTKDERVQVAKTLNCHWIGAGKGGCGKNTTWACVKAGKCQAIN